MSVQFKDDAVAEAEGDEVPVPAAKVPAYLESTYWWAYVRPWAVTLFEREWLVDLILWGNYRRLRDGALALFGERLPGRTLQLACVYGDLTNRLNRRVEAAGGSLDVVDVLGVQLDNLRHKLPSAHKVGLLNMDSSALTIQDKSYDRVLMFFLLHEQPRAVRERTLAEAFRVVKPDGAVMIVDFAKPRWWNPMRYLWLPILGLLEPFAPDLWRHQDITRWLPEAFAKRITRRETLFGGLYQIMLLKGEEG